MYEQLIATISVGSIKARIVKWLSNHAINPISHNSPRPIADSSNATTTKDRKQSQRRSAMKTNVSGRKSRRSPLTASVERHCVNGSPAN